MGAELFTLNLGHRAGAGRRGAEGALLGLKVAGVLRDGWRGGWSRDARCLAGGKWHAVAGDGGEALQFRGANVSDFACERGVVAGADERSRSVLDTGALSADDTAGVSDGDAAPTAIGMTEAGRAVRVEGGAFIHELCLGDRSLDGLDFRLALLDLRSNGGGKNEGAEVFIHNALRQSEDLALAVSEGSCEGGWRGTAGVAHGHCGELGLRAHGT